MQFLSRIWQGTRWFFRRFQVIRWLILIGLTVMLGFSAWFTYKAKTADVENIKSTLQTKTVIYDANNEEAGTLYGQKGTYASTKCRYLDGRPYVLYQWRFFNQRDSSLCFELCHPPWPNHGWW